MKKVFLGIMVLTLMLSAGTVFAGVQVELNKVSKIHCDSRVNYLHTDGKYYPVGFRFQGIVGTSTDNRARYQATSVLVFGTASDEPYPLKTFEDQKAYYQALPSALRATYKALFTTGTGDDVSQ